MKRLRSDPFSRRERASRRPGRVSLTSVALLAVSIALLLLSRIDHGLVRVVRDNLNEVASPLVRVAMVPFDPMRRLVTQMRRHWSLVRDNARLVEENERLKSQVWRVRELEQRLAALAPLARILPEQPAPYVTVRVLAASNGAFVRALMIEAGRAHGVSKGMPVIDASGLIGRVVAAGQTTSQVLLLSDGQSRIPVEVGPDRVRALLIGDNSTKPYLDYLPRGARIEPGYAVATSGAGGAFPKGLRVGQVAGGSDPRHVVLAGSLTAIDYVSVLLVEPGVMATGAHRLSSSPGAFATGAVGRSDQSRRGR